MRIYSQNQKDKGYFQIQFLTKEINKNRDYIHKSPNGINSSYANPRKLGNMSVGWRWQRWLLSLNFDNFVVAWNF